MIFDTHAHPYLSEKKDMFEVLENIKTSNTLNYITCIGTDLHTSETSIALSKKYDFVYASVWIHPCHAIDYKDNINEVLQKLEHLMSEKKVVAIWECWLDFFRLPPRLETSLQKEEIIEIQKNCFRSQIRLAQKHNLPVVIHNRDAKEEVFQILLEENCTNFIMHCYSEDLKYAEKLIAFAPNCMISFSGIVTFNSAKSVQETAKNIPLKNIIIETDSPYLTPPPHRGEENYPEYVAFVLDKIISLRTEGKDIIEKQIFKNSLKIFWIKNPDFY